MNLLRRLGLRARMLLTLGALVLITVGGGLLMIWYTYQMEALLASVIQTDRAAFQAIKGLESALLNQRGYVSYYFLDGDPHWLRELGKYRQDFTERLNEAKSLDYGGIHKEFLDRITSEYQQYVESKDRVIELHEAGEHEAKAMLHRKVREHFFEILDLCEAHIESHNRILESKLSKSHARSVRLRFMAAAGISAAVVVGALLSFLLVTQILDPIRRLAMETDRAGAPVRSGDEMTALKYGVRDLIQDMGHTHMELERSRERLMQSEKMALVGKLAAEVAHSIRNPMTSIKMRLFSLDRSLELSPTQREDFEVISDEMRQLDNIVRNFLEFSRPPKLKVQRVSVSDVLDQALQLLEKRLERYGVKVERERRGTLPHVEADPELLKEVFVNLIVNACDAMGEGGWLVIKEEDAVAEHVGRAVLIQLSDTGPGIPESIRDKILEPFFSTKEEGTGLGLSIAVRIVEEHGGHLGLRSEEGKGTTFTITLPVPEEAA